MVDRFTWERNEDGVWGMQADPHGQFVLLVDYQSIEYKLDNAINSLEIAGRRIAEQSETINQLTESVELWMERAGRNAP